VVQADEMMGRIGHGMQLGHQGEREAARLVFTEIWNDMGGESGDPVHRCALAHAMADIPPVNREEPFIRLVRTSSAM